MVTPRKQQTSVRHDDRSGAPRGRGSGAGVYDGRLGPQRQPGRLEHSLPAGHHRGGLFSTTSGDSIGRALRQPAGHDRAGPPAHSSDSVGGTHSPRPAAATRSAKALRLPTGHLAPGSPRPTAATRSTARPACQPGTIAPDSSARSSNSVGGALSLPPRLHRGRPSAYRSNSIGGALSLPIGHPWRRTPRPTTATRSARRSTCRPGAIAPDPPQPAAATRSADRSACPPGTIAPDPPQPAAATQSAEHSACRSGTHGAGLLSLQQQLDQRTAQRARRARSFRTRSGPQRQLGRRSVQLSAGHCRAGLFSACSGDSIATAQLAHPDNHRLGLSSAHSGNSLDGAPSLPTGHIDSDCPRPTAGTRSTELSACPPDTIAMA